MKPAALIFWITFVFSVATHAQAIYGITDDKNLVKISTEGCAMEVILSPENMNPTPDALISDIAYEQGRLYIAHASGICTINPENGAIECIASITSDVINGLTGDQNGHLYLAGSQLSKYTISTGTVEVIGSLYPYYTSGDIEYVNGTLYITVHGNGGNYLLRVQTNPFSFSILTSIPDSSYGLVKSPQNPEELYVTDLSVMYSINLSNGFVLPVCEAIFGIYGLTSAPENLVSSENIAEFPNIFSPNGDQKNDLFTYNTGTKKGSITITNRWGNIVFYSDLPFSWDGKTSDGTECTEGVYYYILDSESESKTGMIHLLR